MRAALAFAVAAAAPPLQHDLQRGFSYIAMKAWALAH